MATILVENVELDFPIYGMQRSLRRALFQSATGGFINKKDLQHRHVTVTALTGMSFELSMATASVSSATTAPENRLC